MVYSYYNLIRPILKHLCVLVRKPNLKQGFLLFSWLMRTSGLILTQPPNNQENCLPQFGQLNFKKTLLMTLKRPWSKNFENPLFFTKLFSSANRPK